MTSKIHTNLELAQLKIRIPRLLHKQLQEESFAQQRSMNAQINFILKQFIQLSGSTKN
ncbi:hypothetical protein I5759_01010 [Acinetobacter bereziniae]|nr:hypothetical protein [Acinetobacter bereziniae]MBJ9927777.1 hypothetical protein [Acinetobacter bereziniae]